MEQEADDEAGLQALIEHAIEKRVMIEADFNMGRSLLAPHSIFTRHDELYLRAQTVERDGRKPAQPKLGTFKLAGLKNAALTRRLFSRSFFIEPEPRNGS